MWYRYLFQRQWMELEATAAHDDGSVECGDYAWVVERIHLPRGYSRPLDLLIAVRKSLVLLFESPIHVTTFVV